MDSVEDAAQIPEAVDESDSGTEVTEEWLMSENDWFRSEVIHYFNLLTIIIVFKNRLQQYILYISSFTFYKCLTLNFIFSLYWYLLYKKSHSVLNYLKNQMDKIFIQLNALYIELFIMCIY